MWVGGLPGQEKQHVRVRVAETVVSARVFWTVSYEVFTNTKDFDGVRNSSFIFSHPGCYMDLMNMGVVTGREDSVTLAIIRTHAWRKI